MSHYPILYFMNRYDRYEVSISPTKSYLEYTVGYNSVHSLVMMFNVFDRNISPHITRSIILLQLYVLTLYWASTIRVI